MLVYQGDCLKTPGVAQLGSNLGLLLNFDKIEVVRGHFLSLSRARALSVEPVRARACENIPQACFQPELFTNSNNNIRA